MPKKPRNSLSLLLVLSMLGSVWGIACTQPPVASMGSELETIAARFYRLRADTSANKSTEARAILQDLVALSQQYPDEWVVSYWLGFVHSVGGGMVEPAGDAYLAQLDSAHLYLDGVLAEEHRLSAEDRAEVLITKANAYQLTSWQYPKGEALYIENDSLARAYIRLAEQANPANPKTNVLKGIPMIYNNDAAIRDEGKAILEEGLRKYAAYQPKNSHYPVWGEGLIKRHMANIFGPTESASN